MTKEEAIRLIGWLKCTTNREDDLEAIDMAIEALSQPIVAKHFDIQSGYIYCSPQIAKNVKVVVQCRDCIRNNDGNLCDIAYYINEDGDGFCNCGERKEPLPQYEEWQDSFNKMCESAKPKTFVADEWYHNTFKEED